MMGNLLFLKVGNVEKQQLRIYLMHIVLPNSMVLCKFGKSSGESSKQRMLQICADIYETYPERRTPSIKIVRDRKCENPFELECVFKEFFKSYRYTTKSKWGGSTECYVIPLEDAKTTFDLVIEGHVPDFTYELSDTLEDELQF